MYTKKIIPKTKSKLSNSLGTFSKNILSKKIASIAVGSSIILGFPGITDAGEISTYTLSQSPTLPYPSNVSTYSPAPHTNAVNNQFVIKSPNTCNHASGIVNGHYSSIPLVNISSNVIYNLTNTHSSTIHNNGGWC